jgi:beta-galactosidase
VAFDMPSDGRDEGDRPGFNDKGLVTYDRLTRKDAYYWYQANWSSKPMLYITSRRDVARTAASVDVKIYSNQSKVRLSLNGADLGEHAVVDHVALWPGVTLAVGPNHLEARCIGIGDAALSDAVDWTLAPSAAVSPAKP